NSGKKIWAKPIGTYLHNQYGSGPRGTPTVDGEHLFVLGAAGRLSCLKTSDGEKVWSVELVKDLGGSRPGWNYAESPLLDGDQVPQREGCRDGDGAEEDRSGSGGQEGIDGRPLLFVQSPGGSGRRTPVRAADQEGHRRRFRQGWGPSLVPGQPALPGRCHS